MYFRIFKAQSLFFPLSISKGFIFMYKIIVAELKGGNDPFSEL